MENDNVKSKIIITVAIIIGIFLLYLAMKVFINPKGIFEIVLNAFTIIISIVIIIILINAIIKENKSY